jgi:hypothetical protein
MIDKIRLEAYLEDLARRFTAHEAHAALMRFMCRCLRLTQQFLPVVGQDAVKVASSFWLDGVGNADALVAARVACWHYLDSHGGSVQILDQEHAAMRAAICVLYPAPDSDDSSADIVRWFAAMFERLDVPSAAINRLMES